MPLGTVVLLQLLYDFSAACTSVVCPGYPVEGSDGKQDREEKEEKKGKEEKGKLKQGPPIHGRTMDWELPMLKELAVEIEYRQVSQSSASVLLASLHFSH